LVLRRNRTAAIAAAWILEGESGVGYNPGMSRTLTISDKLYQRLEAEALARGFENVEQLLEDHASNGSDFSQRRAVVDNIDRLRNRMFAMYGEMPDSTELIREDRSR